MNLFLLAAGLGTRLLPFTEKTPKPAIPFLNVPMGLYQFQYLSEMQHQLSSFTVNTHHLPLLVEDLYNSQPYLKMKPKFSLEAGKILGNGGALKKAQSLMTPGHPILLMNADEVYFSENKGYMLELLEQHTRTKALATLAVMKHAQAGKTFGAIWCDQDKSVKHIGKTSTDEKLIPWHYIGGCILSWEVLSHIKEDTEQNILYDVLFPFLHRLNIFELKCDWFETGNKDDLLLATQQMLAQLPQQKDLLQFINTYDPSELIQGSLVSSAQAIDSKNLDGFNCIGKTATINDNMQLKNCIAFADQLIK